MRRIWQQNGGVTRHSPASSPDMWSIYRISGAVIEWYSTGGNWQTSPLTAAAFRYELAAQLVADLCCADQEGRDYRLVRSPR
jgi:hypothetical protein